MSTKLFDQAAEELARQTDWTLLTARGTLRIAMKAGGVEPEGVGSRELRAVVERLMPRELELRGIGEPELVCAALIERVGDVVSDRSSSDSDEVFRRLAGD